MRCIFPFSAISKCFSCVHYINGQNIHCLILRSFNGQKRTQFIGQTDVYVCVCVDRNIKKSRIKLKIPQKLEMQTEHAGYRPPAPILKPSPIFFSNHLMLSCTHLGLVGLRGREVSQMEFFSELVWQLTSVHSHHLPETRAIVLANPGLQKPEIWIPFRPGSFHTKRCFPTFGPDTAFSALVAFLCGFPPRPPRPAGDLVRQLFGAPPAGSAISILSQAAPGLFLPIRFVHLA